MTFPFLAGGASWKSGINDIRTGQEGAGAPVRGMGCRATGPTMEA